MGFVRAGLVRGLANATLFVLLGSAALVALPPASAKAESSATRVEAELAPLRALLDTPEDKVDFATAKLTIDHLIDPSVDVDATLKVLDEMAAEARAMVPLGAGRRATVVALMAYIYQPGPWNHERPFSYDLDDPFGKHLRNKLLTTYLATRKGNCVSMPTLFVILGQKLGLEVSLSTAPTHVFAKVRDDDGQMLNIEAASGGTKSDAGYKQEYAITDEAVRNGIYLQSLTRRESVAVMVGTLLEFYGQQNEHAPRIAVAQLALDAYPKDVTAMLHLASSYQHMFRERFVDEHGRLVPPSPNEVEDYHRLGQTMEYWGNRADSLGWRENTPAQDAAYAERIRRIKAEKEQGR